MRLFNFMKQHATQEPMDKRGRRTIESYRQSGKKAAQTNKELYGNDFYQIYGAKGGKAKNPNKGFGSSKERARKAGAIGGRAKRKAMEA